MVNLSIRPGRGSGCESTSNLPSIKMLQLLVCLKADRNCFLNNKSFPVKNTIGNGKIKTEVETSPIYIFNQCQTLNADILLLLLGPYQKAQENFQELLLF